MTIANAAAVDDPATSSAGLPSQSVVVFDMDGTLFPYDSQTIAVMKMMRRGILPVQLVLSAQWWVLAAKLGLRQADAELLLKGAAARLKGQRLADLQPLFDEVLNTRLLPHVRQDAKAAIAQWRQKGAYIVIASAAIEPLVAPVAAAVGADAHVATRLGVDDGGHLTGELAGRRLSGVFKRDAVVALADARFDKWHLAAAYGDHVSDIQVLEIAEQPIVVTPTAKLRRHARNTGWTIVAWR